MKIKILVICTGNSCRSIMFEAAINYYAGDKFESYSAGSFPVGYVHKVAIKTLQNHKISTESLRSKGWDVFKDKSFDLIITVCDNAANESCPLFLGNFIKVHLGLEDPAKFVGSNAEIESEFERVFKIIEKRVQALSAINFSLSKEELLSELNKIAKLN